MNLKGELKFENLVALQRDSLKTLDKPRKRITILKIVAILLLIFTIFLINPSRQPIAIAINIVSTVIFALLLPIIINKAAVRQKKKSENSKRMGPFSLYLSEEGIEIQRENDSKHVLWKEINQVTSDNENLFLYYGKQSAIVIPKNAVPSQAQLIEFLSAHVGQGKVLKRRKVGLNEKQRRVVLSLFVAVLVFLFGVNYYSFQPDYDVSRATRAVSDLFVYTDVEGNGKNKIKESTTQGQIDLAIKDLDKIDINDNRYEKYDLLMLSLYVMVNEAQQQLNQREVNAGIDTSQQNDGEILDKSGSSIPYELEEEIDRESDDYKEIVNDIFGIDVYIPEFESYDIVSIENVYSIIMEEEYLTIKYSKERGELKDEDFIEQREENFNSIILYGIFDEGSFDFKITYHKESHFTPLDESIVINDINVEYKKTANTFKASFSSHKGTYEIQFNLNEMSEEGAFEIIDKITNKIND